MWFANFFKRLVAAINNFIRRVLGRPPYVRHWLLGNPSVRSAIAWQSGYSGSAYVIDDASRHFYDDWSARDRSELQNAFDRAWRWLEEPAAVIDPAAEGIAYPPDNIRNTGNDNARASTDVEANWAREFYMKWTAFSLAIEIKGAVPWSVRNYSPEALRILFDVGSMMVKAAGNGYGLVNTAPGHPNYSEREHNRGSSMPAPPMYTWTFLETQGMVGATREATIRSFLSWVSANCAHFYGDLNYGGADDHWQYRGVPPISRILEGTTHSTGAQPGFAHWTAGCHGTTGLLRHVLRAANVPVAITTVCGHSQAVFLTEGLYLDHGDNPYNSDFTSSGADVMDLLIDGATYAGWFGPGTDNREEGCDHIGRQVADLTGPR